MEELVKENVTAVIRIGRTVRCKVMKCKMMFTSRLAGRRYARWHLWQDKLSYIIVFFMFIVWLEWTIHSQVFSVEVR